MHKTVQIVFTAPPSIILEQNANALAVMHSPDSLRKHVTDLQHLQFLAPRQVLILRHAVCHNDLIQTAGVDPIHGIARKHSMCYQGVDARGARLFDEFCSACDCIACIG